MAAVKPHHRRLEDCMTRPKYREGREKKAVKVYTINQESRYLLVQGVPALNIHVELINIFSRYGKVEQYTKLNDYPAEEFTEVFWVKFERTQSARVAKKKIDDLSFFGGVLHVCYAPEFETVDETRQKLMERRKGIARRIRELEAERSRRDHAAASTDEDEEANDSVAPPQIGPIKPESEPVSHGAKHSQGQGPSKPASGPSDSGLEAAPPRLPLALPAPPRELLPWQRPVTSTNERMDHARVPSAHATLPVLSDGGAAERWPYEGGGEQPQGGQYQGSVPSGPRHRLPDFHPLSRTPAHGPHGVGPSPGGPFPPPGGQFPPPGGPFPPPGGQFPPPGGPFPPPGGPFPFPPPHSERYHRPPPRSRGPPPPGYSPGAAAYRPRYAGPRISEDSQGFRGPGPGPGPGPWMAPPLGGGRHPPHPESSRPQPSNGHHGYPHESRNTTKLHSQSHNITAFQGRQKAPENVKADRDSSTSDPKPSPAPTGKDTPLVRQYKPTGSAPKFVPRKFEKKQKIIPKSLLTASKSFRERVKDAVNEELRKNTLILDQVAGPHFPEDVEVKRQAFRESETGDKSLDLSVVSIREKVKEFSAKNLIPRVKRLKKN